MDQQTSGTWKGRPVDSEVAAQEAWQQSGKWFTYEGHAIFSRMAGQGEPLLLIHGFPTARWDWHRLWPMLVQGNHLLAPDMLGFGFSDKPRHYAYSIEDQSDLIQGMLEGLGLTSVHLLAHDYGCSVAQELLAREQEGTLPFEIASVCFLNGALFPEVHSPLLIQNLLRSPLGRSEEHTSELQSRPHLVCRLLLEKKNIKKIAYIPACDQDLQIMYGIGGDRHLAGYELDHLPRYSHSRPVRVATAASSQRPHDGCV